MTKLAHTPRVMLDGEVQQLHLKGKIEIVLEVDRRLLVSVDAQYSRRVRAARL